MTQVVAIFPIVPGRGELVIPPLPEGPVVILGHHVFPEVSRGEGPHQERKLGPAHWQGNHEHLTESLVRLCLYKMNERCRHVRLVVGLRA